MGFYCFRSINQSIALSLLFLFCSRVFLSRSYENRSNAKLSLLPTRELTLCRSFWKSAVELIKTTSNMSTHSPRVRSKTATPYGWHRFPNTHIRNCSNKPVKLRRCSVSEPAVQIESLCPGVHHKKCSVGSMFNLWVHTRH